MKGQKVNYYSVLDDYKNGLSIEENAKKNNCSTSLAYRVINIWEQATAGNVIELIKMRRHNDALAEWASQFLPHDKIIEGFDSSPFWDYKTSSSSYSIINLNVLDTLALDLINKTLANWLSSDTGDLESCDKSYISGIVKGINAMADAIREKLTERKGVE
ncbi:MAG: hypothetical protein IKE76_02660 [Clostridia bacterium]|nr:hypothetical protein [Clostridia bacterium]